MNSFSNFQSILWTIFEPLFCLKEKAVQNFQDGLVEKYLCLTLARITGIASKSFDHTSFRLDVTIAQIRPSFSCSKTKRIDCSFLPIHLFTSILIAMWWRQQIF